MSICRDRSMLMICQRPSIQTSPFLL